MESLSFSNKQLNNLQLYLTGLLLGKEVPPPQFTKTKVIQLNAIIIDQLRFFAHNENIFIMLEERIKKIM